MNILGSTTLDKLYPGESGTIVKLNSDGNIKKRLLDLGIVKGTKIKVNNIAPLGNPVEIIFKGFHLLLRKEEISHIEIEQEEYLLSKANKDIPLIITEIFGGRNFLKKLSDENLSLKSEIILIDRNNIQLVSDKSKVITLGNGQMNKIIVKEK